MTANEHKTEQSPTDFCIISKPVILFATYGTPFTKCYESNTSIRRAQCLNYLVYFALNESMPFGSINYFYE